MIWLFRSIFVFLIYSGITFYSGLRIFSFLKLLLPSLKAAYFWPFYAILPYGIFFVIFLRLYRIEFFRLTGMYLPPFFFCLFGFIFLFDIASLVLLLINRQPSALMPAGTGASIILAILLMVCGSFHARNIKTAYYNINYPRTEKYSETEKLRVVLVSDLHIGATVEKKWIAKIVELINEASPDIVCIAGDIFDGGIEGPALREDIASELKRISARMGAYACPGNHDVSRQSGSGSIDEIKKFLSQANIILLADEIVSINMANSMGDVYIAGRRDARPIGLPNQRLSLQELYNTTINNNGTGEISPASSINKEAVKPFIILLDHQPIELPEAASAGFDLVLCGHTHKGQFFPGNIFTS
jgi:predicted MPP superfamily phosphohydrolase